MKLRLKSRLKTIKAHKLVEDFNEEAPDGPYQEVRFYKVRRKKIGKYLCLLIVVEKCKIICAHITGVISFS